MTFNLHLKCFKYSSIHQVFVNTFLSSKFQRFLIKIHKALFNIPRIISDDRFNRNNHNSNLRAG